MPLDIGEIGYRYVLNDRQFLEAMQRDEQVTKKTTGSMAESFKRLAATIAVVLAMYRGFAEFRKLTAEIGNIKSIAPELDASKIEKELLKLNSNLGSTSSLANAMYFALSSGVSGSEEEVAQFTGEVAKLAKTIRADVTPVMDAVTTTMNAYGLKIKDVGMVSDWFFQIVKMGKAEGPELANSLGQIMGAAAVAKVPLDDLGAAIATLTTTMPTRQAITALNQAIMAFISPTDEAKQAAGELVIELTSTMLAQRGLAGAFADVTAKSNGNIDALTKIFTSIDAIKAASALAGSQSQTFANNVVYFMQKSGSATAAYAEQIGTFDAQLRAAAVTGEKILAVMSAMIIKIVTLGGALNPLLSWFGNLNSEMITHVAKIGAVAVIWGTVTVAFKKFEAAFELKRKEAEQEALNASVLRQAAAEDQVTAALQRQYATRKAGQMTTGGGKITPVDAQMSESDAIRRWDVQSRWDARNARQRGNRAAQVTAAAERQKLAAYNAAQSRSALDNDWLGYPSMDTSNARVAAQQAAKASNYSFVREAIPVKFSGLDNSRQSSSLVGGFGDMIKDSKAIVTQGMGSIVSGFKNPMETLGKGVGGLYNVLSGGSKGISGALSALSGVFSAAAVAFAAYDFGKMLGEKMGLAEKFDNWFNGGAGNQLEQDNQRMEQERNARMQKQADEAIAKSEAEAVKAEQKYRQSEADKKITEARRNYEFETSGFGDKRAMLQADLLNARADADSAKTADLRAAAIVKEYETRMKLRDLAEQQKQYEAEFAENQRSKNYSNIEAMAWADGYLSTLEEIKLKETEIMQAQQKAAELRASLNTAKDAGERMRIEREIAELQSGTAQKAATLEQQRRDNAEALAESERNLAMSKAKAAVAEKGGLANYSAMKQLEISQQQERIKSAEAELARLQKINADQTIINNAAAKVYNEREKYLELNKTQTSSQGSFSAAVLAMMGSGSPAERTARATEESRSLLISINDNTKQKLKNTMGT